MNGLNDMKKEFTLGQTLKGHLMLTRPQQLIWLDVFASLAFFAIVVRGVPTLHFFLFVGCAVICDAGACTINDVGDIDSDCKSKETSRSKRPLCIGVISKNTAMVQGFILYAIGLMIAFFLDFYMFLAVLALVIISYEYSMKPLKLDAKPVFSQAFWISFALLDYLALVAYLQRYVNVPVANYFFGLYFLAAMILFMAVAETLAKDLRDLENDRWGGKVTTPSHFGARAAAVASFSFSVIGSIFWIIPYFSVYRTNIALQLLVVFLVLAWNTVCLKLCISIYRRYAKSSARALHKGFILTFTLMMTLSFLGGVL